MAVSRIALVLLTLSVAIGLPGCAKKGRPLAPVSGKVAYQGKLLKFGVVIFQPESGHLSEGVIQPDGMFQMSTPGEGVGAVIGKNRVRVACFESQDPRSKLHNNKAGIVVLGKPLIPEKYLSCETSGLTVDVHSDRNPPLVLELGE
jgi:hypothetical protein